ncbi:MAG TPA: hypothetical protein VK493_11920, partial [Bryobacteraceae bacterium]|nr:hypothetical protein [Bryobacteraceae bacterium]
HLRAWDQAWVRVSFWALLAIATLGIFAGRRMRALHQVSSEIRELVNDPRLQTPIRIRFSILLGVVFLMVAHANLALSLSIMGGACDWSCVERAGLESYQVAEKLLGRLNAYPTRLRNPLMHRVE